MKKTAALALLAIVGISGCAAAEATVTFPEGAYSDFLEPIRAQWVGDDMPSDSALVNAGLSVCSQFDEWVRIEDAHAIDGPNNSVVVDSAVLNLCRIN